MPRVISPLNIDLSMMYMYFVVPFLFPDIKYKKFLNVYSVLELLSLYVEVVLDHIEHLIKVGACQSISMGELW